MKVKKLYLFTVVIVLSFLSTSIARGLDLKALQDTLRKLGNPWTAGTTSVSELPIEQKRKLCSPMLSPSGAIPEEKIGLSSSPKDSLPSEWDWRDVNGHNWMTHRKIQGVLSPSIIAHLDAFEPRIKIVNNSPDMSIGLSAEFIAFCCTSSLNLGSVAQFIIENGVPDGNWQQSDGCNLPDSLLVKAIDWGETPEIEDSIKNEIMNGPIVCAITVKEDFFYYKGGVYEPIMGEKTVNDVICCFGWTSSGSWILKNSWNGNYFYYGGPIKWPIWLSAPYIGVEESVAYPEISGLVLSHNPSRSTVSLSFYLPDARKVSINIYDIAGREVHCLANKLFLSGSHKITYNRDKLLPGIYFLRFQSDKFIDSRKLILL